MEAMGSSRKLCEGSAKLWEALGGTGGLLARLLLVNLEKSSFPQKMTKTEIQVEIGEV